MIYYNSSLPNRIVKSNYSAKTKITIGSIKAIKT